MPFGTSAGKVQASSHLDPADTFAVDKLTGEVSIDYFATPWCYLGGVASADQLRTDEAAVNLVREFFRSGPPVAAICHAPWAIIEADQAQGRTMTSWPSLQTDIRNWRPLGRRGGHGVRRRIERAGHQPQAR